MATLQKIAAFERMALRVKKVAVLSLVALMSLGLLTGCGSSGAAKELTVEMGDGGEFKYTPAELQVNKGDNVKVKLINKDAAAAHTFLIKELNVKSTQVQPNQTGEVKFKADKTGEFEFYCDVAGHKEGGMIGKITVK